MPNGVLGGSNFIVEAHHATVVPPARLEHLNFVHKVVVDAFGRGRMTFKAALGVVNRKVDATGSGRLLKTDPVAPLERQFIGQPLQRVGDFGVGGQLNVTVCYVLGLLGKTVRIGVDNASPRRKGE